MTGTTPRLGMSALLGGGVFVPVVVTAAVAFAVPGRKIARRPYIRDVMFLFCGVGFIVYIVFDGYITKAEAFSLWLFYALYVLSVILGEVYRIHKQKAETHFIDSPRPSRPRFHAIDGLVLFSQESPVGD